VRDTYKMFSFFHIVYFIWKNENKEITVGLRYVTCRATLVLSSPLNPGVGLCWELPYSPSSFPAFWVMLFTLFMNV
jgi:hypothetical protein